MSITVTATRDSTQDIEKQVDDNTIYNVTGDTNPTQALLEAIYPVGSIYIGTMAICPLSELFGTWALVSSGRVLQGADENHSVGTTVEAGLPNITGSVGSICHYGDAGGTNALRITAQTNNLSLSGSSQWGGSSLSIDASDSDSIYGNSSTVQPPAYVVNIWQRTA